MIYQRTFGGVYVVECDYTDASGERSCSSTRPTGISPTDAAASALAKSWHVPDSRTGDYCPGHKAEHIKTPPAPAIDLTPIKNLVRNWWNWTILDFALAIGKPIPVGEIADAWIVEKFDAFYTAATALRQFDDETLTTLCTKHPRPERKE